MKLKTISGIQNNRNKIDSIVIDFIENDEIYVGVVINSDDYSETLNKLKNELYKFIDFQVITFYITTYCKEVLAFHFYRRNTRDTIFLNIEDEEVAYFEYDLLSIKRKAKIKSILV